MVERRGYIPPEFQIPAALNSAASNELGKPEKNAGLEWPPEKTRAFSRDLGFEEGDVTSVSEIPLEGVEKPGIEITLNPQTKIQMSLFLDNIYNVKNGGMQSLIEANPLIVINNIGPKGMDIKPRNSVDSSSSAQAFHVDNDGSSGYEEQYFILYMAEADPGSIRSNPTDIAPIESVRAAEQEVLLDWFIKNRTAAYLLHKGPLSDLKKNIRRLLESASSPEEIYELLQDPEKNKPRLLELAKKLDFGGVPRDFERFFQKEMAKMDTILGSKTHHHYYKPAQAILLNETAFKHRRGQGDASKGGSTVPIFFDPPEMRETAKKNSKE